MLTHVKFKRLKINAGFTESLNGHLCVKISEKEYHDSSIKEVNPPIVRADPNMKVWVDSYQVKKCNLFCVNEDPQSTLVFVIEL